MNHGTLPWGPRAFWRCLLALVAAMAASLLAFTALVAEADGQSAAADMAPSHSPLSATQGCMECHGKPDLAMTLPSGEKLSLYVDEAAMGQSVHSGKLICTDCHSKIGDYPHRKTQVETRREYSIAQYEACKRCHFSNYTQTLDGIHYRTLEAGNPKAPLCTDCHGSHQVTKPDEPRTRVAESCGSCHQEIATAYQASVHGIALEKEGNPDVPTCTDCHGTHLIKDASATSFRLDSPEMCAKCHANATLMAKYGLSPNVFKTYVQDFHGKTVELTKRGDQSGLAEEAVCSDCHGVHDIKSVRQGDAAELKRNIVATCQKCHQDAGSNFPDAWLSHYELSPSKAPLPWLVRTAYALVIPFMVAGLALHLLVDLWRIARNR